jgi:hypothetical protein
MTFGPELAWEGYCYLITTAPDVGRQTFISIRCSTKSPSGTRRRMLAPDVQRLGRYLAVQGRENRPYGEGHLGGPNGSPVRTCSRRKKPATSGPPARDHASQEPRNQMPPSESSPEVRSVAARPASSNRELPSAIRGGPTSGPATSGHGARPSPGRPRGSRRSRSPLPVVPRPCEARR